MTSMLDVIFLLLCFFVTVSVFSQWENEISIKLPSAETSDEPDRLPGEIIVNLAKDGTVVVVALALESLKLLSPHSLLELSDLQARLKKVAKFYPGQPVIIRADKELAYEKLVKVIDTCRAADVWNFSLATDGRD